MTKEEGQARGSAGPTKILEPTAGLKPAPDAFSDGVPKKWGQIDISDPVEGFAMIG